MSGERIVISAGSKWHAPILTRATCVCKSCAEAKSRAALVVRLGAGNVEIMGQRGRCSNEGLFAAQEAADGR